MKNELTVFPAIFTKMNDDGSYYIVDFIDLKNCTTEGETIQEAYYMAQNAMGLFLDDLTKFPKPTLDFSNIKLNKDQFISFIGIDMNDYRKKFNNKSVKKTLKKLKKKTYYIQVRAYVVRSGNVKVTGDWSKIKKVKVRK